MRFSRHFSCLLRRKTIFSYIVLSPELQHDGIMIKRIALLALFLLPASAASQDDLLGNALKNFGLDSSTVGFRPQSTWINFAPPDPFRLPWFDGLLARPLKIPSFTREMLWRYHLWMKGDSANFPRPALAQVRPLAGLIMNSGRNLGHDIGKFGLDYSPRLYGDEPLLHAIEQLYRDAGQDFGDNIVYPLPTQYWTDRRHTFREATKSLPEDLRNSIARIVTAIAEAARWRDRSLHGIPSEWYSHIFTSTTLEESQCDAHTFDQIVYDAALAFDGSSAAWGATLLAQAVEKEFPTLRKHAGGMHSFNIPTPLGRLVLSGGGNDVHYAQDCALLIDLGGDDVYYGAVGASGPSLPVSVAIDVAGNDRYLNEHVNLPSQGAGVLGIGILIDLDGNDTYTSRTFSQGCGRFGVGLLYDERGNDTYTSLGFSQGAGMYGIGILFDRAGNDAYHTVYYAQGYGFARGLGLLADLEGDDRYIADDTDLIHVGDQTPLHNESNAQGFASGRRADHTDGHNMSGGVGILTDLHGNDVYSAGTFAQASAYWYGIGVLHDAEGDDQYRGVFFNLGAAAHFAIGILLDDAGDDVSDLVMTLGFGTAHDASAAFYIDLDGNDTYTMSNADERACSFGSSLNNSFALFANIRGDDSYSPVGNAFGYATSRRGGEWAIYAPSIGLFFDIGGNDTYNHEVGANDSEWSIPGGQGIFGYGIDAASGMLRFEQ